MKKIFEYIGLFAIIAFSFYYTEKAALIVRSKNPIMQSINEVKDSVKESSVNAVIKDNTIVPGLYGKEVNVSKSFNTMKSFGLFNKYYLVYDSVIPEITLEDHKDKTIISGNPKIRNVALIIAYDTKLIDYFNNSQYPASLVVNQSNYVANNLELINSESKKEDFNKLENTLTNAKKNVHICLTNTAVNINECKKIQNYLVKPSLILKTNNLVEIKNQITNGSIIYIESGISIEDLNILINQINYQGLNIVKLSTLISEQQS